MEPPATQYVQTTDGINIAYWELGEGPPLLVDLGVAQFVWEAIWNNPATNEFFEALARDHRLIGFDFRGHGASDRGLASYSLDGFVEDLHAVVKVTGNDPVTIFSLLVGGVTTLRFAAHHPDLVSTLVLWHPVADYEAYVGSGRHPTLSQMDPLRETDSDMWEPAAAAALGGATEDAQALMSTFTESRHQIDSEVVDARNALKVTADLPLVQAPSLILMARDQKFLDPALIRSVAVATPNARLETVPGAAVHPFGSGIVVEKSHNFMRAQAAPAPLDDAPTDLPTRAPTGAFQTILFTDLAASTALTQRLGDAGAQDLVRTHNQIIREALSTHNGHEIKHTGDGIMASFFPAASQALDCAQTIQRAATDHDNTNLGIKIGCNAGEPIAEEDDLYGTAVQIAARATDQATAGEIIVTNVVRELVAGKTYLFGERPPAALKGLEEPVRLFNLRWQDD
jgi:class 3 adenylate cyclase/pimeloyl-ACP methyl ester carboxylesterase